MPASPTSRPQHRPDPSHQLHLSDPPSSAESRTVTFPAYNPPAREDGNKITQVDLDASGPRSPDRLKAALQAQESPGWSFVMKNEDFDFQYPKKISRSDEPPLFKRPSEEDKPRRHLLSFGRKKSKAVLNGSGSGSPGRNTPSPRPMMPSPKPRRFPPLSFNPTSNSNSNLSNRHPSRPEDKVALAEENEESEEKEEVERPSSFEPLTLSPRKMKPPPTPPKPQTQSQRPGRAQTYPTPAHIPLPPSPDRDRDSKREQPTRDRQQLRDVERDQPSPLDRYFNPSPARAVFDRHSPSKRSHFGTVLDRESDFRGGSALSNRPPESMPTRQGLRDMLLASMDLLLEDHFITLESNHQAQTRRISHLERSTQDSSLALVQAQADYTALENTLMEDRQRTEGLSTELEKERKLRKQQAQDATSLISQLEKQSESQKRNTTSLEGRVGKLTQSLKESQGEIDRLEAEMTKGYTEMNGRLSNIGRLERETGDWKRRAEEAEFTVKALREEGVRMSRELEKRARVIEQLEKGRKFVTRV